MTAEAVLREIHLYCTGIDAADTEGITPEEVLKSFRSANEITAAMIRGGNKYGADADKATEQMRKQRNMARRDALLWALEQIDEQACPAGHEKIRTQIAAIPIA